MIKSKDWNQARCECGSWHWALLLDENYNVIEYKCCRCSKIEKPRTLIPVLKFENANNGLKTGTIGEIMGVKK